LAPNGINIYKKIKVKVVSYIRLKSHYCFIKERLRFLREWYCMDLRVNHGRRILHFLLLHDLAPPPTSPANGHMQHREKKDQEGRGGAIIAVSAWGRGLEPTQTIAKKQGLFEYTPFTETVFLFRQKS
jgi:hypothetical protein